MKVTTAFKWKRKPLRFDYILSKKLENYKIRTLVPAERPTVQRYKPSLDYMNSSAKLRNISRDISFQHFKFLFRYLVDLSKPNIVIPQTLRKQLVNRLNLVTPVAHTDTLKRKPLVYTKWLTLCRLKQTVWLRQLLKEKLINRTEFRRQLLATHELSSVLEDKALDFELEEEEDLPASLSEEQTNFLDQDDVIFSLTFIDCLRDQRTFFKNIRRIKQLISLRNKQVKAVLMALVAVQFKLKDQSNSMKRFNDLIKLLQQTLYLNRGTNRLDQTFYSLSRDLVQSKSACLPAEILYLPKGRVSSSTKMPGLVSLESMNTLGASVSGRWHKIGTIQNRQDNFERMKSLTKKPILSEIIEYRAVSRTRAGGRTRRFRVLMAIGRKSGWIGIGLGKHKYIPEAMQKAKLEASKNIIRLRRTTVGTIPHSVIGKFKKAQVLFKPLSVGSGMMIGAALKQLLVLAGYNNVWGLQMGTNDRICNVRASLNALSQLRSEPELLSTRHQPTHPYESLCTALHMYVKFQ